MNWIRISVGIGDDPRVHVLANDLGVSVSDCVGLLVLLLTKLPEHAQGGDLSAIPDSLLERWAWWHGQRGEFAPFFRRTFLTEGRWAAWEKHNGAALRDAQASRERAAEYRRRQADRSAHSTANGSPNGTANGTDLRTDVRTNQTTGRLRARTANGHDPPPYIEGRPIAPPFCTVCGGEPNQNEKGRIVGLRHKEGCTA